MSAFLPQAVDRLLRRGLPSCATTGPKVDLKALLLAPAIFDVQLPFEVQRQYDDE